MSKLKLNSLDRYFLAQERAGLSFVSSLVLELAKPIDRNKLQKTISIMEAEMEIGRIRFTVENLRFIRKLVSKSESKIPIVKWDDASKTFNLAIEAPMRVGVSDDGLQLILSLHHAAADGSGQLYILSQFFKAWQEIPLEINLVNTGFRMREVLPRLGIKIVLQMFVTAINSLFQKKKIARTLISKPVSESRQGTKIEISLNSEEWKQINQMAKLNRATLFEWVAYQYSKSLEKMAKSSASLEGIVTLIVPVDLRSKLKIPQGLQNCVGLLWVTLKEASEKFDSYQARFRHQIRTNEALHFLPIVGIITTLFNSQKSAKILQNEEKSSEGVYSTSLFSFGRIPSDIQAPSDLNLIRVRGYGALERSPGLTLTGVSYGGETTLTLQYLTDGFEPSIMLNLAEDLRKNLLEF